MNINRTWLIIIGGVLIIVAAGIAQFLFPRRAAAPKPAVYQPPLIESNSATTSNSTTTSTTAKTSTSNSIPKLISITKGDTIASWNFTGVYANNPELIAKAEAEIMRLSDLIGKGTYPDVTLYVGIANQYELLGDGKQEYEYFGRAIGLGGITGLPWHNLGVLMERLGALQTARIAYENATLIQPEIKFYHYAYFEFLTTRMKDDTADIEKEFAAAKKNLGQDSDILQLYSEWKNV